MRTFEKNNLPKSWQLKKLGDVCVKIANGAPAKQYDEEVGFPIARIETIWNQQIDVTRVKFVKENDFEFVEKYALRHGDILFSHINSDIHLGKTAIYFSYPKVLIHGINILLIRTNELIDPCFLNFYFNFLRSRGLFISIAQKSVNQSSINQTKLKSIDVVTPPLPTQRRIVAKIEELFTKLDKGISHLKAAQQQLKTYRQSLLKAAFEGRLTNKNVIEGELPKGWRNGILNDLILSVEYGSSAKSGKSGKVPVLRMGNIQNGRFNWDDLVYTNDNNEIEKYKLRVDDVLFNRTNSPELVGKTAIYKGEVPAIFAGYLIRINFDRKKMDPNFLNYYLNSDLARNYGCLVKTDGVNQSNINGQKLKGYPIPILSILEQRKIVEILESKLSSCDELEQTIKDNLTQTEQMKQSILKQAFEGKLI